MWSLKRTIPSPVVLGWSNLASDDVNIFWTISQKLSQKYSFDCGQNDDITLTVPSYLISSLSLYCCLTIITYNLYELPFGYFAYMISLSICPYNESLYCFLASYIHFIHDLGLFFQNWFPLPLGLSRTYVIYSFSWCRWTAHNQTLTALWEYSRRSVQTGQLNSCAIN